MLEENYLELSAEIETVVSSSRPSISQYSDALDSEGKPLFVVGDKLIIERYINFGKTRQWLDTRTYTVSKIDIDSGEIKLFDDQYKQSAYSNFKRAHLHGDVIKLYAKQNSKMILP